MYTLQPKTQNQKSGSERPTNTHTHERSCELKNKSNVHCMMHPPPVAIPLAAAETASRRKCSSAVFKAPTSSANDTTRFSFPESSATNGLSGLCVVDVERLLQRLSPSSPPQQLVLLFRVGLLRRRISIRAFDPSCEEDEEEDDDE